jgi:hypothetical protein
MQSIATIDHSWSFPQSLPVLATPGNGSVPPIRQPLPGGVAKSNLPLHQYNQ